MSILNRIAASFGASVDKAVSQFENHEAVIDASIADSRSVAAKAKVRNDKIIKEGEVMRHKLGELQKVEALWVERARVIARDDEQKALECLQRRNICRKQISALRANLLKQEELEQQLGITLDQVENKLAEIIQQRNSMRSRHAAADAMKVLNDVDSLSNNTVDAIFERWEVKLTEAEYQSGQGKSVDNLEAEFARRESDNILREELATLLQPCSEDSEGDCGVEGDEIVDGLERALSRTHRNSNDGQGNKS